MYQNQPKTDWAHNQTVSLTSYQSLFAEKVELEKDNKLLANAIVAQKDQTTSLSKLKKQNA